ncbi:MAG: chemotaxis response regulator protein-glutamate methylesterase [Planctomyces sp.]|jgi:two-component system chemotaxis response regulator CheB
MRPSEPTRRPEPAQQSIRVLFADDSAVTRLIITDALKDESGLELIGCAEDGNECVAMFRSLRPDVVLLDVDMPNQNGIETLRKIRSSDPHVPVIMFSTLTVRGGDATLDALSAGATDYVAKPSGVGTLDRALEFLRAEVIPKLRQWGKRSQQLREKASGGNRSDNSFVERKSEKPALRGCTTFRVQSDEASSLKPSNESENTSIRLFRPSSRVTRPKPIQLIAIGSSTGGPTALAELICALPGDLSVPVVIAQHMPPIFTGQLAERLDRESPLTVREGIDGAVLRPGEVWVAPGDFHMTVSREGVETVLRLNQNPPENSCRPAVDVLFRSAATVFGGSTLAVVLTGMGRDGTLGCQALKVLGANILVQDEASSVVWGMPRSVIEAGLADAVLPLKDIAAEIRMRVRSTMAAAT